MPRVFDADSHLMEIESWVPSYADPGVRDQLSSLGFEKFGDDVDKLMAKLPKLWDRHRQEDVNAEVLAGPKGWMAPGSLDAGVRSKVLDTLGINAQLVFPTFALAHFGGSKDPDVLYGGSRALNRAMVDFCSGDPRLLAVCYLPLDDPERALGEAEAAIAAGAAAIWVPSEAAGGRSPAHLELDRVWAVLAEAGTPFVLHIGGGKMLPKAFHDNGRPMPADWLGGGENLRGKDFPVVHHSPERFLACLALDGVFERHPALRGAAIELGANWVPSMLRNVELAHKGFAKSEPDIAALPLTASDYIRRQVRFTPYVIEDTSWLIEQCGPELFMFSTDYPHPEGGRHPFERFGEALSGFDDDTRERFFWRNGAEVFGLS
jgi:uncharacterized protein